MRLTYDAVGGSQRVRTPEGYLEVPATFARAGIYEYRAHQIGMTGVPPNKVVRVWRPEDEVFAEDAMRSFARKPVTNDHPSKPVTLDTVKGVAVGWSDGEVSRDGKLLSGHILIHDREAIEAIDSGKSELSCGYAAEYEYTSGTTFQGEAYDAIQRNIRGNHIAIVDAGRAGPECAIADEENGMKVITIDAGDGKTIEVEVEDSVATAFEAANTAAVSAAAKVSTLEAKVQTQDAEIEELKKKKSADMDPDDPEHKDGKKTTDAKDAEIARLEGERDAALASVPTQDAMIQMADQRAGIINDARRLFPEVKIEGESNESIQRQVVDHKVTEDVSGKSAEYIAARFDALKAGGGESAAFAGRNLQRRPTNDAQKKRTAARDQYIQDSENAWKNPTGAPQAEA